jgi:hypothetical protein
MKRFQQFRSTRLTILVCTMALTACTGLSSRNVLPEHASDNASGASPTAARPEAWWTACSDRDGTSMGSNLGSCMAIPSTWNGGWRVASGYFYGIDCCGQHRVALIPGLQAPVMSTLAHAPHTSDVPRVELMYTVFRRIR